MIKAISRDKAVACAQTSSMILRNPRPESARNKSGSGGNLAGPAQLELSLEGRVLHTRAQSQLQAVAQGAQVRRTRCEAVHALISASDGFFLGARVVHHRGVLVHGHLAARQATKVHRDRGVLGRQQV